MLDMFNTYPWLYVLDDGEDVNDVILSEDGLVSTLDVVLSQ